MSNVDSIRNGLIDKILAIRNKDFLEALDKLVSTSKSAEDIIELSDSQKALLQMSEDDLSAGRTISQDEMMKRNLKWLDEM
jgi:hypothetical protein